VFGEVGSRLGHRLYLAEPTRRALHDGWALAIRRGMSTVTARSEVVSTEDRSLAGRSGLLSARRVLLRNGDPGPGLVSRPLRSAG
jgi:hypothetical protein